MKKLIFILIFSSLFAQYLPDVSSMSETEKTLIFQQNKKNSSLAVIYPLLIPTTGHAYANNWKRGLGFLGAEILAGYLMYNRYINKAWKEGWVNCELDYTYQYSGIQGGGCYDYNGYFRGDAYLKPEVWIDAYFQFTIASGLVRIFEIVDASKQVKKYNNNVYRKIFNREPPSFSMKLQPTYQGANLTMSYSLD